MNENRKRYGRCLCGAVEYEVDGPMKDVVYCHCEQCRRTTGNLHGGAQIVRADLTFLEDRGLTWFKSSDRAERGFCNVCGSNLFFRTFEGEGMAICPGTLDTPTGLKGRIHIFVDEKPDYYEITDDLPQKGTR